MASLSRILRLKALKQCFQVARNLTSQTSTSSSSLIPTANLINNPWIYQRNDKIEAPLSKKIEIDFPNGLRYVPPMQDPISGTDLELPATPETDQPKEAIRMIVIRRKKMKKHKLKKLRKKMKFEWAKRRQRREWNKEKLFQAELIQQCKQGEAFSAEKYVEERLAKFKELTLKPVEEPKRKGSKQV